MVTPPHKQHLRIIHAGHTWGQDTSLEVCDEAKSPGAPESVELNVLRFGHDLPCPST